MTDSQYARDDQSLFETMKGIPAKESTGSIHVTQSGKPMAKVPDIPMAAPKKERPTTYPSYPAEDDRNIKRLMAATKWAVIFAVAVTVTVIGMRTGDLSARVGQVAVPIFAAMGGASAAAAWIRG